jgi:arginine exporter protein ArgO
MGRQPLWIVFALTMICVAGVGYLMTAGNHLPPWLRFTGVAALMVFFFGLKIVGARLRKQS